MIMILTYISAYYVLEVILRPYVYFMCIYLLNLQYYLVVSYHYVYSYFMNNCNSLDINENVNNYM